MAIEKLLKLTAGKLKRHVESTDSIRFLSIGAGVDPVGEGIVQGLELSSFQTKRGTGTQTFTTSSLANDSALTALPFDNTGWYWFRMLARANGNTTDNFKMTLAASAGLAVSSIAWWLMVADPGGSWEIKAPATALGTSVAASFLDTSAHIVIVEGGMEVTTPGEVDVQWAKNIDTTTPDLSVLANRYFTAGRLGS